MLHFCQRAHKNVQILLALADAEILSLHQLFSSGRNVFCPKPMLNSNRKPESLVPALKRQGCAMGHAIEDTQQPGYRILLKLPVNHGARQTL